MFVIETADNDTGECERGTGELSGGWRTANSWLCPEALQRRLAAGRRVHGLYRRHLAGDQGQGLIRC